MTTKPREDPVAFIALTLFNNDRHVAIIDFDDLVKRFGKTAANRMLDALTAEPASPDWIVETWAAKGSIGVVLAGADPLHAIMQLAGLAVAIGYNKPWSDIKPTASGPVLFVTSIGNVEFVNLALTGRRSHAGAQATKSRLAVLGVETLALFDGEPSLTTNWHNLLDQMDALKPLLVIVDGRNGVLAGDGVRWFGTLAYALARMRDCSVLLLVDGDGEDDAGKWSGCGNFRFAFTDSAGGSAIRAALAAAVARGELPAMPK